MFTLPYYYFRTSFYGYGKNLTFVPSYLRRYEGTKVVYEGTKVDSLRRYEGIYEGTKYEGNR